MEFSNVIKERYSVRKYKPDMIGDGDRQGTINMKVVPLKKQSKKEQRRFHARLRRDWNGLKPTTRVVKSKKVYDRKKLQKPSANDGE